MANLTQEQINRLIAASRNGAGDIQDGGRYYSPINAAGADQSLFGGEQYIGGDGTPGGQYNVYNQQGADTGRQGTYADDWAGWIDEAMLAAMLAAGGAAAFGAGGGGGASAAGGGGGAVGTMAPMELLPASLGEYSLPGLMGTGGTGAAGLAGAAGGGGGAIGTMAPMELLPASLGEVSLPGLMGGGGGLLGKALGVGSTVLGGLAGSKGKESEQTSTRDIPEWLKPYVQKNLGYASGLLDKQMAPGAMPGWEAMRNQGMGLLSQPIAGNGFSKFYPGK